METAEDTIPMPMTEVCRVPKIGGLQDIVSLLEEIEMTETIENLMRKIESLESSKAELFETLNGALSIKDLWPGAFNHGAATTYIRGSHSKGFRFYIKNGIGEEESFDLNDIPLSLACAKHIKTALKEIASVQGSKSKDSVNAEILLSELWKVGK